MSLQILCIMSVPCLVALTPVSPPQQTPTLRGGLVVTRMNSAAMDAASAVYEEVPLAGGGFKRRRVGAKHWQVHCKHGGQRAKCKECGGSAICEHGRRRSECRACGGTSFCEHSRERRKCKECGGSSICEHGKLRHRCKKCQNYKLLPVPALPRELGGAECAAEKSARGEQEGAEANADANADTDAHSDDTTDEADGNLHGGHGDRYDDRYDDDATESEEEEQLVTEKARSSVQRGSGTRCRTLQTDATPRTSPPSHSPREHDLGEFDLGDDRLESSSSYFATAEAQAATATAAVAKVKQEEEEEGGEEEDEEAEEDEPLMSCAHLLLPEPAPAQLPHASVATGPIHDGDPTHPPGTARRGVWNGMAWAWRGAGARRSSPSSTEQHRLVEFTQQAADYDVDYAQANWQGILSKVRSPTTALESSEGSAPVRLPAACFPLPTALPGGLESDGASGSGGAFGEGAALPVDDGQGGVGGGNGARKRRRVAGSGGGSAPAQALPSQSEASQMEDQVRTEGGEETIRPTRALSLTLTLALVATISLACLRPQPPPPPSPSPPMSPKTSKDTNPS